MTNSPNNGDTTGDLFACVDETQKEQSPLGEVSNDVETSNVNDILSSCTLLRPQDHAFLTHPVIAQYGSPNRPIYIDNGIITANGIQYQQPLIMPLYNANMQLVDCAVVQVNQPITTIPHGVPKGFAYYGELDKDKPIIINCDIEAFFKVASTDIATVLVVTNNLCTKQPCTTPKAFDFEQIKCVIGQLTKAGYHKLYMPVRPEHIKADAFVDLEQRTAVRLLNQYLKIDGCDTDWIIDLSQHDDSEDIAAFIHEAIDQLPQKNPLPKGHLAKPMRFDNGTFEILSTGVWYTKKNGKSGDERTTFISSPVLVLAKTRDDTSNDWGRLLQWNDDAGVTHTWSVSMELFQTDGAELRKALANQGVTIASGGYERTLFQTYLMSYPVEQRALCVNRVGWYEDQYVLPHEVIGQNANDEIVVYQSSHGAGNKYITKGTLQDWQQHISKRTEFHNFLVLALCTAFAGQLLEPLNLQGMGIHYKGKSSKGKSTAVFVASTVWGNPELYHHTWRSTGNAMERTAFTHNHGLLALDEIGEIANPKEAGNIIYMLTHGHGKNRMSGKTLELKEPSRWKLVFVSSGEKTLSEVMGEVGQKTKLGQEIRFINIDIDQSQYGIFDQVDFADDAAKQAVLLNSDIKRFYGTAGKAWLDYLTSNKAKHTTHAKALIDQYSKALTGNHTQGHIVRVANYFALVAAAGELATQAGITTWQKGRAFDAVQAVFNHWIGDFDQVGDYEDREILAHVKGFIILNGSSRFEHIEQNIIRNQAGDPITQRINNRVGYWKQEKDGKKYLVYPELFKSEICKGYDYKKVVKVLNAHGWFDITEKSKPTKLVRLPDQTKASRIFVLNHKMWEWENEQDTDKPNNIGYKGYTGYNDDFNKENLVTQTETKKVTGYKKQVTNKSNDDVTPKLVTCNPNQNSNGLQNNDSNINAVTHVTHVTQEKTPIPTKRNKPKDDLENKQGSLAL